MNDEGALKATIRKIVANNPKSVEDYKAGKKLSVFSRTDNESNTGEKQTLESLIRS